MTTDKTDAKIEDTLNPQALALIKIALEKGVLTDIKCFKSLTDEKYRVGFLYELDEKELLDVGFELDEDSD